MHRSLPVAVWIAGSQRQRHTERSIKCDIGSDEKQRVHKRYRRDRSLGLSPFAVVLDSGFTTANSGQSVCLNVEYKNRQGSFK